MKNYKVKLAVSNCVICGKKLKNSETYPSMYGGII